MKSLQFLENWKTQNLYGVRQHRFNPYHGSFCNQKRMLFVDVSNIYFKTK